MKKTLYLRDLLPFIAYGTALHLMEIPRKERCRYGNTIVNDYEYMFPVSDEITREAIEQCYPELLDREIADGIHGEGEREGIYIHLYKDPERRFKTYEEPFKGKIFTLSMLRDLYQVYIYKKEYPEFDIWLHDMLKSGVFEEVKE